MSGPKSNVSSSSKSDPEPPEVDYHRESAMEMLKTVQSESRPPPPKPSGSVRAKVKQMIMTEQQNAKLSSKRTNALSSTAETSSDDVPPSIDSLETKLSSEDDGTTSSAVTEESALSNETRD